MESIYAGIDQDIEEADDDERRESYISWCRQQFSCPLIPGLFSRSQHLPELDWRQIKYTDHAGHDFPDHQGVYMFTVNLINANLPTTSYVMYVGKAGDIGSQNTIRRRFRDYVNESGYRNRIRIRRLIKYFSAHLIYHYAVVPEGNSTSDIESMLCDIFTPPCCQSDFSPEARTLLRGARIL